ncbi:hypothetical protein AVEN_158113-1 [Araneus ventricosus]|uniref:Uncharacterized protein n=1 Tax=Araneus ventricosus TaxID=182803 RepID=A0A4Y2GPW7_ARAVE|nr:hypothetical protein AVEN_158113-1 [Araneus ventricosus]
MDKKLLSLCLTALRLSRCDASETIETRGAAQTLLPAMCDFLFLCLWNNVFNEVNHVQKYLQIFGISFEKSVIKMTSLKIFLKDKKMTLLRKHCNLQNTCEEMGIPAVKRRTVRRKKIMPGAEKQLTLDKELKRSMLECTLTGFNKKFVEKIWNVSIRSSPRSDRFAVLDLQSDRNLGN